MAGISVLGAGAWGTALAVSYAQAGHAVRLWSIDAHQVEEMRTRRENVRYLSGLVLPESISIEHDFTAATQGVDLLLIVTPVAGLRETLHRIRDSANDIPVLWACKGFETGTGRLPHEVVAEVLGQNYACGALTGPSFAEEVAQGMPCAITLASSNAAFAESWIRTLSNPRLRLYANDDLVGAEVGGAVKNVLAIAAGIADGLSFGLNARAAMMTRGLAEIARLAVALGGRRDTLMGLSGMGDLILTCTGDLSRNRRVGLALAAGEPLAEVLRKLGHVAEGVLTTQMVVRRADELGVEMPISRAVHEVLAGRISPRNAVEQLMARNPRAE